MTTELRYRIADGVVWIDASEIAGPSEAEPVVWACLAVDPQPRELRDWAWLIWHHAVPGGTCAEITEAVSAERPLPDDDTVDVAAFLQELTSAGLLTTESTATVATIEGR